MNERKLFFIDSVNFFEFRICDNAFATEKKNVTKMFQNILYKLISFQINSTPIKDKER